MNYEKPMDEEMLDSSPTKPFKSKDESASDLDFAGEIESDGDVDEDSDFGIADIDPSELPSRQDTPTRVLASSKLKGMKRSSASVPFWKKPPRKNPLIGKKTAIQTLGKVQKQQGSAKRPVPAVVRQPNGAGSKQAMSDQPPKVAEAAVRKPSPKSHASQEIDHDHKTASTDKKPKSFQEPTNSHQAANPKSGEALSTPAPKLPNAAKTKSVVVAPKASGKPGESLAPATQPHKKKVSSENSPSPAGGNKALGKAHAKAMKSSAHSSNVPLITKPSKPIANQDAHEQTSKQTVHETQPNTAFLQKEHPSFPDNMPTPVLDSAAPNIPLKLSSTKIQPSSKDRVYLDDPPSKSGLVKVGEVEFIQFSLQGEMEALKENI